MSDALKFWMKVYIASIRSGSAAYTARAAADHAVLDLDAARKAESL